MMMHSHLPSPGRHPVFWLLPLLAMPLLWPLAQSAHDQALFLSLNDLAANLPDRLWSGITILGDTLVALCLLLPLHRRRPDLVVAALLAALPGALLSHGLKDAFDVARPFAVLGNQIHVIGPHLTSGSFPSGHTTTAFLLASILAGGSRNQALALGAMLVALLVGLARIAVGAHWPLDIIGGMVCGWVSALIGLYLARRFLSSGNRILYTAIRIFLIGCTLYLFVFYDSGYPLAHPFVQALCLAGLVYNLLPGWSSARHEQPPH